MRSCAAKLLLYSCCGQARTMSVVKTVKGRKALLTALEQTPKDKLRWWDHKQRILEQWLDTSGDEITVEGASSLIRGQLQRGEQHEHLRIKCWKHIVIELSALVEDDTAPSSGTSAIMSGRRSYSAQLQQRGSEFLSPSAAEEERQQQENAVDLAELSFVERQEEWLRRKQHTIRAKTNEVERAVKDAATFNPNLAISQSSLRPAQVSAVELKLEQLASEAERHARRSSFSQSIQESKRRTERESLPISITVSVSGGGVGRRRTRMKRRGSTAEDSVSPRRGTAPPGSVPDSQDPIGHLNPAGDGNSDNGIGGSDTTLLEAGRQALEGSYHGGRDRDDAAGREGERELGPGRNQGEGEEDEEEEEEEEEKEEDREPPFDAGSFFFKVDDKDKGHYKVRDVSHFLLTSMYKRKDRVTRTAGVSLLVGKLEHPPHEEKVISALFDTDRFSERAASQWWEDNGHRFEDARSLAEKKEFDDVRRRTMERNSEVLRRASAPAKAATTAMTAIKSMSSARISTSGTGATTTTTATTAIIATTATTIITEATAPKPSPPPPLTSVTSEHPSSTHPILESLGA